MLWPVIHALDACNTNTVHHIYQKNFSAFYQCQQQRSEAVFWEEYRSLKATYPEAENYLDNQLTPNVQYWAGFRHTRFTTGAVSTQRGEGLNRHFKHHLSAQSPLCKLFDEACLREEKEAARLFLSEVRDELNTTEARNFAVNCFPEIVNDMKGQLTGYGQSFLLKQMSSSGQYIATEVDPSNVEDNDEKDQRQFHTLDQDLADFPKARTAKEMLEGLPAEQQQHVRVFKVWQTSGRTHSL